MSTITSEILKNNLFSFSKKEGLIKILTIKSIKTGDHFTYNIKQGNKNKNLFFVGLLSLSKENDKIKDKRKRKYNSILKIRKRGDLFDFFDNKKNHDNQKAKDAFVYAINSVFNYYKNISHQVEFSHDGYCVKCGMHLTDPESVRTGIGPVCSGRNIKNSTRIKKDNDDVILNIKPTSFNGFDLLGILNIVSPE